MRFLLVFAGKNLQRWKARFFSIALILALSFTAYVLYASYRDATKNGISQQAEELQLPYDLLVVTEPRHPILAKEELPAMPRHPRSTSGMNIPFDTVEALEQTCYFTVESSLGALNVLGIPANSAILNPEITTYQGSWPASAHEAMLPQSLAESLGLSLGSSFSLTVADTAGRFHLPQQQVQLVGTYTPNDLAQVLMRLEDVVALSGLSRPNACLFTYTRLEGYALADGTIPQLTSIHTFIDWLRPAYPQARFISAITPQTLTTELLGSVEYPNMGLLALIVSFALIAVFTISLITYIDRRREYATTKTLGTGQKQLAALFSLEYGVAGLLGLGLGITAIAIIGSRISFMALLQQDQLRSLQGTATVLALLTVIIAQLYPMTTVFVASVDQLLYTRKIPFRTDRIDHLERPTPELVRRERNENLRFIKLMALEGSENDIMLLKQLGDRVKKGEIIAQQERLSGYMLFEWEAFCDGVIALHDISGLIGIRPDDPQEGFYPYDSTKV